MYCCDNIIGIATGSPEQSDRGIVSGDQKSK